MNYTDYITETDELMVCVEIPREEVKQFYEQMHLSPKNSDMDDDATYTKGEIVYHFDKQEMIVGEVLLFPVYENEDGKCNGDFIGAPNRYYECADEVREYVKQQLWNELTDVYIDDNDCIDTDWYIFTKGTSKYDIWHWFEDVFKCKVAELLNI